MTVIARRRGDDDGEVIARAIAPSPHVDAIVARAIEDDREHLREGDRVLLVIEDDLKFARIMLSMAREKGFKVVVATRGDTGIALANELTPDAITLDIQLPVVDGWAVLDRLKRNPRTRHIPVHVISVVDRTQRGAVVGAFAYLEKPVSKDALDGAFEHISSFIDRKVKELLLVEDDATQSASVAALVGDGEDVAVTAARDADEAQRLLDDHSFDCMVVDLMGVDGMRLIEQVRARPTLADLPIIVYTGKQLTRDEEQRLKQHTESIIIKSGVKSPERLLNDTALFLHRQAEKMPPPMRRMLDLERVPAASLAGKRVLVVDDDARNIFAITSVLESHQLQVIYAEDGRAAMEALRASGDVDLILMDVMMPELDGYETMRAIRRDPAFESIPIVAITAKALKEDRDKCIQAGASDYLPKPIDADKLLELIGLWTRP
jgi:CheY-like chemotaxis protein